MSKLVANKYGLVPVKMLVSEAGIGVVAGEVRGVPVEVAEKMIQKKTAELYEPTKEELAAIARDHKASDNAAASRVDAKVSA